MSYQDQLSSLIHKFITDVSLKLGVSADEMMKIWDNGKCGNNSGEILITTPKPPQTPRTDASNTLMNMKKDELTDICKSKGIKHTGKKEELIARILDFDTRKTSGKEPPKKILNVLKAHKQVTSLSKNAYGNYEFSVEDNGKTVSTGLIISSTNNKCIGRQVGDTIMQLTPEDIELCHQYKLSYDLPDNLNPSFVNKKTQDEEDEAELVEEIDTNEIDTNSTDDEEEDVEYIE